MQENDERAVSDDLEHSSPAYEVDSVDEKLQELTTLGCFCSEAQEVLVKTITIGPEGCSTSFS